MATLMGEAELLLINSRGVNALLALWYPLNNAWGCDVISLQ